MFSNMFSDLSGASSSLSIGDNLQAEVNTTDATPSVGLSIPVPEGRAIKVTAQVTARLAGETKRAMWTLSGLFYRNTSGNVTIEGDVVVVDSRVSDGCAYVATLAANTTSQMVEVQITGTAAETVYWTVQANYFRR